jgi:PAS domain S-box-containing protein
MSQDEVSSNEDRLLLAAPTVRDGAITRALMAEAGVYCIVCQGLANLSSELSRGAGAILISEHSFADAGMDQLIAMLEQQPSWSDIPIIALIQGGAQSSQASRVLASLRNVMLLERPAPTRSIVSAVQAALRARRRQYQIRDQLEEIQRAQWRFQAMANSIPQLAWMARSDGWIFWYNQQWHDYCGTTLEQMQGWGWQSVHDQEAIPRVMAGWNAAVQSGLPWEDTFRLRRHDGQLRWHLSRARPFRDPQGNVILWFGTNTDVTEERLKVEEREHLLEREQAARLEAERAGKIKDEFLATLSHELRTPLNAILGWSQLLRRADGDGELLAEGIQVIERNTRVQVQLIEDLLDMSRIISGKIRLHVGSVDPASFIDAAIQTVEPSAAAKGIRLVKQLSAPGASVLGDPARLQQVIWNLLSNSIKFTPAGGTVAVIVELANQQVEIRVRDTGQGIDPQFLPHVFERFRQADASTTRAHGGLGLGLAIVKYLVELHGGRISASSDGPDRGSTFTISLPALNATKSDTDEQEKTLQPSLSNGTDRNSNLLRGIKILVVDDEPDARRLIKRLLEGYQARVFTAESAAAALPIVESKRPDILLSDIGMPDVDGYEFLRRVRALGQDRGGQVPAIALTAFARSEDRTRALLAGFLLHISKPVEPRELVSTLATVASRRS